MPLFRAQLGADEFFTMDPCRSRASRPRPRARRSPGPDLLRRWLDGSAFEPARAFRRSWRRSPRIETAPATFALDKGATLVESFKESGEPGLELVLGDYRPLGGCYVLEPPGPDPWLLLEFRFTRPEAPFE